MSQTVPFASAPAAEHSPRRRSDAIDRVWFLVALVLLIVHMLVLSDFTIDDAFISYRYAANIAEGAGATFNSGERIEGFSNPLYTFLLAGADWLLRNHALLPLLGRGIGMTAAVASLLILFRLPAWPGGPARPLALLSTATCTSVALWSVAGLETTLYGCLILMALWMTLTCGESPWKQIGLGLLLASITLSRPEGVLPAGALYLARFLDPAIRRDRRGHLIVAVAAAAPVVAYLSFRIGYYGEWLPNTYYAKRQSRLAALRSGLRYLADFAMWNGGLALYLPAPLALRHRVGAPVARPASAVVAACCAFILVVGADYMNNHRFLAPVVPVIFLLVALGWDELLELIFGAGSSCRWAASQPARIKWAAFVIVFLTVLWGSVRLTASEKRSHYVNAAPYYETIGRLLGAVVPPEFTVAVHDIGAIGFYGRTRILDLFGLVDREIGHGLKTAAERVADGRPELVVLHYDNRDPPLSRWRALDIPDFENVYQVPRAPFEIPASLRVRADVLDVVEERLADLPACLRLSLTSLSEYLKEHQPDGRPVLPFMRPTSPASRGQACSTGAGPRAPNAPGPAASGLSTSG